MKEAVLANRQRKKRNRSAVSSILLAAFLAPGWSSTTAATDLGARTEYRPPAVDLAPRRVGGTLRSLLPSLPALAALVPDHLGLTRTAQPVLYWFISAPTAVPVEFTLVEPGIEAPLAERALPITAAGVQRIDLATHGVRLQPGIEYEWRVALVPEARQRSRDVVAGGAILRVDDPDGGFLDAGSAALAGYWYDALMALEASGERIARAALLEQAGMPEVANYERER